MLSANERLALGDGAHRWEIEETVVIQAEALVVQTISGERSGLITADQIENIALKGRDNLGTLRMLPDARQRCNRQPRRPTDAT